LRKKSWASLAPTIGGRYNFENSALPTLLFFVTMKTKL
jgi:hypothetical protein